MVPGLETVNTWASLHHERLGGKGYPFGSREFTLGSRIVAVADVFTAITENRPYRSGMARAQCLTVLDELVADGAINGDVVVALRGDFEQVHHIRYHVGRVLLTAIEFLSRLSQINRSGP